MRKTWLLVPIITLISVALAPPRPLNAIPPDQRGISEAINPYPEELVIPLFPELARRASVQGTVECEASIVDGRIYLVEVITGHPLFNDIVKQAVKQWTYDSGIRQRVRLSFMFHLVDDKERIVYPVRLKLPREVHLYSQRLPGQMQFSKQN